MCVPIIQGYLVTLEETERFSAGDQEIEPIKPLLDHLHTLSYDETDYSPLSEATHTMRRMVTRINNRLLERQENVRISHFYWQEAVARQENSKEPSAVIPQLDDGWHFIFLRPLHFRESVDWLKKKLIELGLKEQELHLVAMRDTTGLRLDASIMERRQEIRNWYHHTDVHEFIRLAYET